MLGEGKISLEECMIEQLKLIKVSKEEIIRMLDSAVVLRSGFEELVEFCRIKDIEFTILSAGLDFYIDHVVTKYGWNNLKRASGTTTFTADGISIEFPKHHFTDSKTFKEDFVRGQKRRRRTSGTLETEHQTEKVRWQRTWYLLLPVPGCLR